ncbi:unnamed protein product [Ostreobium quekettii]|uniref:Protein kinase domain-containing protein n=1 Tax=Ostreobium quekettii TaxID=121088 RepID=A0A8S1IRJ4_9CHLO|nr:unnamed protein product [Ostreobium quekettii]
MHGSVREGVWFDGRGRAIKVAVKPAQEIINRAGIEVMREELQRISLLPYHPNVVWVVGARLEQDPVIVEELMASNLNDALYDDDPRLTYLQILKIALDVARGVGHLHRHGMAHCGIKPSNILLDGGLNAKLADFVCSKVKAAAAVSGAHRHTLEYMAPECLAADIQDGQVSVPVSGVNTSAEKVDIYSFGKVVLECVSGKLIIENSKAMELCPKTLWGLICQCLSDSSEGRPSCEQIEVQLEDMMSVKDSEWLERRPKQDIW